MLPDFGLLYVRSALHPEDFREIRQPHNRHNSSVHALWVCRNLDRMCCVFVIRTLAGGRASRLCLCVRRVGGPILRLGLDIVWESVRAIHSANGATACLHIGAVCDSRTANDPISRQLPLRSSKNHSFFSGVFVIKSKRYPSINGRTGSIRSHARLSRLGVSKCRKPKPGSSPSVAKASRHSDSNTA